LPLYEIVFYFSASASPSLLLHFLHALPLLLMFRRMPPRRAMLWQALVDYADCISAGATER